MAIDVKEFILSAIREGVEEAPAAYMRQLDTQLKNDVKIQESGDAVTYLQSLIDEAEQKVF